MKKRLGLDLRWLGFRFSGVGMVNEHLMNFLLKHEREREVIFFASPETADLVPQVLPENFRVVKTISTYFSFAEQIVFLRNLMKEKLDLMHFTNFNAPLLYPRPFVATVHDLTTIYSPGKKMPHFWRRWPYFAVLGNAILRSKKVITVSHFTQGDITKHFPVKKEKITVTHLGSAPMPEASSEDIENVRKKYRITATNYFLYTSVFRDHKNPEGLIRAFSTLTQKLPDHMLVLAGRAEDVYRQHLEKVIDQLGIAEQIVWTGTFPDEDRAPLMRGASVFVQPSFFEGFGTSLLDAMAADTPIASSSATSLPEVGGDAALYFDPYNIQDMAQALLRLTQDRRLVKSLIEKGKKRVETFSWEKMGKTVQSVYDEVLG